MTRQTLWIAGCLTLLTNSAQAGFEEDYELKNWQEIAVQLPSAPKEDKLIPFYVSAATDNRFFVDPETLTVGTDGVVRYTLVILTGGGARNISYEGMRCQTRERRVYAFGRRDGNWSQARSNQWEKIRESDVNRHHAALFLDYFCPGGVLNYQRDDIVRTLLRAAGK